MNRRRPALGYTRPVSDAETIPTLAGMLRRSPLVACAWLFGSVARGTATDKSDVDVAVLCAVRVDPGDAAFLALQDDLTRALGRPVQVVVADRAPADLVHRILRDGVLLVDADPSRRIRFEVRRRNEYWDLEPHLLRYRRVSRRAS